MIESPILQELKAEWSREATQRTRHQDLIAILTARFGPEASGLSEAIDALNDDALLEGLVRFAAVCPDLDAFRARLEPRP